MTISRLHFLGLKKGEAVDIPLGGTAPIINDPTGPGYAQFKLNGAGVDRALGMSGSSAVTAGAGGTGTLYWSDPNLVADLSSATAATINQLRMAFQVQKMLERDARGGTRYTEMVRSHFGVISPDARLQRPEFRGGGSARVNFTPIAQTAPGTEGSVGALGALATGAFQGHGFTKSFTEHGFVIGLCNIRADLNYQQGIPRHLDRVDRFSYYWPALANIGEQEVLSKEIYADGTSNDNLVFGYQERYGEYRYKPSTVHGKFRSNDAQSLDSWHLAQEFATRPTLSSTFIEDNPPIDRVIAVPSEPQFICDFYHNLTCARPMPLYGVPGNIDRF